MEEVKLSWSYNDFKAYVLIYAAESNQVITEEEKDEETGQVLKPAKSAGNRYGIRYSELHSFIVAGFNARIKTLEDA